MDGALTLAGVDPDHTPLHRWLGAAWAALIQCPVGLEELDKAYAPLAVQSGPHGEPDRDTWGLLPEHQAGQDKLLKGMT